MSPENLAGKVFRVVVAGERQKTVREREWKIVICEKWENKKTKPYITKGLKEGLKQAKQKV